MDLWCGRDADDDDDDDDGGDGDDDDSVMGSGLGAYGGWQNCGGDTIAGLR